MTISRRTIRYISPGQPFPSTTHKVDRFTSIFNSFMLCTLEIILFLYLFSVFCLFLVKNTFGLRFHFRLDRLLGQNIPLSLSLCALVTRLEISIAITASVYSLLLTKPNKEKINSLLVKVKLFFNKYRIIYVAYPDTNRFTGSSTDNRTLIE